MPFRVRMSEAGPCTLDGRSTGGCPAMGDGCGCSFLPLAVCPTAITATDAHPALTFPALLGVYSSLKTHLPTCRLWYTKHLQIPVQKKPGKTPQIPQELSRGIVCSAPAAQSVCTLALASVLRGPCAGSSLFPSEGALAASAKGFRLITRSSLSPASEIKGTARQQSKSLVRMRFTCRDGFRTCHGEEQQKDHVC